MTQQPTKNEYIKKRQWRYLTNYLQQQGISYQEYLRTDHWKDVRSRFWKCKLHHYQCFACGGKTNLQVHHKTYKRIGKEYLTDLCMLCGDCHKKSHEIEKTRTNGILWGAAKRLKKDIENERQRSYSA